MKLKQPNHIFAKELNDELLKLSDYIKYEMSSLINPTLLNEVIDSITLNFDDYNKPHVSDTIRKLTNLINDLKRKYSNKFDNESEQFNRILGRFDENSNNICCEGLYFPLFKEDRIFNDINIQKDADKLKDTILSAHSEYYINGHYNHSKKEITIFTKNINNDFPSYVFVFAHEFFHAIHLFLLRKCNNEKLNHYYHCVVLESLATAFQMEYINFRVPNDYLASSKFKQISEISPIFFPYSGAKYLYENSPSKFNLNKFLDVFNVSFYNFKNALRILILDKYEVEIILQKKDCCNFYRKVNRANKNVIETDKDIINRFPHVNSNNSFIGIYQVNQDNSFFKEFSNGIIEGGCKHNLMDDINRGDIIFHTYNAEIVAVSIVIENQSNGIDHNCRCEYLLLNNPIKKCFSHTKFICKVPRLYAITILENIISLNPELPILNYLLACLY